MTGNLTIETSTDTATRELKLVSDAGDISLFSRNDATQKKQGCWATIGGYKYWIFEIDQDKNKVFWGRADSNVLKTGDTMTGQLHINLDHDVGGTAAPGTYAPFVIGPKDSQHIEMDTNEILCKSDGTTPSVLWLQDGTGTVKTGGKDASGIGLYVTTGNLQVTEGTLTAKSIVAVYGTGSTSNINAILHVGSNGVHGLYSHGYGNGSTYTSNSQWMIYRGQDGGIHLNGDAQAVCTASISPNTSSETHAQALKKWFDNNKASIPRNQFLACYDSTGGNGSMTFGYFLKSYDSNPYGGFFSAHYGTPYYIGISSGTYTQSQLWKKGDAITGAVYNDYAEYRESHDTEFGYVVQELGDDTLQKTTKRLSHFAGVTSDTWGFAQGETEKAKTPIAVAGRVLVYPGEDRNKYQPGDCVCAGPEGKVYIMTREETKEWPDRIVGTVSCVPDYDTWGIDYDEERPKIKINGRIWIKVR